MMRTHGTWTSIDDYIAAAPSDRRALLQALRAAIRAAAPDAAETINYAMPAFVQNGTLVYFASLKNHIGFYPTSSGIAAFQDEVSRYEGSKGAVRFPVDQPLPLDLIQRIVQFRVGENRSRRGTTARVTTVSLHDGADGVVPCEAGQAPAGADALRADTLTWGPARRRKERAR